MPEKIDEADYTRRGTLKVEQPVELPAVVDVFVAGGDRPAPRRRCAARSSGSRAWSSTTTTS